jgi:DNA ligase D-like protein (predicted 3'-phosphoesterase)
MRHSSFPHATHGYHSGMRLNDNRRKRRSGRDPRFVIQQGAPGSDHYDLGLEIDGVLVSWAIPKDSRMARRTAGRPLEDAEGDIAGDHGIYANATPYKMAECLERGHLSFFLAGESLRGWYTLTRIRAGDAETWLLMRRKDDEDADTLRQPALTGHPVDDWS